MGKSEIEVSPLFFYSKIISLLRDLILFDPSFAEDSPRAFVRPRLLWPNISPLNWTPLVASVSAPSEEDE